MNTTLRAKGWYRPPNSTYCVGNKNPRPFGKGRGVRYRLYCGRRGRMTIWRVKRGRLRDPDRILPMVEGGN